VIGERSWQLHECCALQVTDSSKQACFPGWKGCPGTCGQVAVGLSCCGSAAAVTRQYPGIIGKLQPTLPQRSRCVQIGADVSLKKFEGPCS
jgi:hypothetical protein